MPPGSTSVTSTYLNGQYLLFSQDSSYVAIASVNATTGLLTDYAHVLAPMAVDSNGYLTTVKCFPNSPPGTTGSSAIPCGQTVSIVSDQGTVSIIPVPGSAALAQMTQTVYQGNHWDLQVNIQGAFGGSKKTKPVAIPARIGDPSLIKHVFVIIRENRTYDQILGDVAGGNGDGFYPML